MKKDTRTVPVHILKIMTEFFGDNLLTKKERDDLDRWIDAAEDNMVIFEEVLNVVESRKRNPKKYPKDRDSILTKLVEQEEREVSLGKYR